MRSHPELGPLLSGDVVQAARGLLGCTLTHRQPDGSVLSGRIVETEAYHQREPGCHAFKGRTERNETMFGRAGLLYVYLIYGMYHCANIVCGSQDVAAAVLVRALEPPAGSGLRTQGPGLLCKAMGLNRSHDGLDLLNPASSVRLVRGQPGADERIVSSRRIGFSFEDDLDWRFFLDGNPHVSKGKPGQVVKRKRSK